jgi:polyisoprenyl-phosphate glycosyltransferase
MSTRSLVSVLVPAFNEELTVERAYATIVAVFEGLPEYDFEIVFTDNHSTDRTFPLLREIAARDSRVKVIRFSRNYGYERSLLRAYQAASGDCAVQIDCDLQDPPELIPEMLALWCQGHQVVYGVRKTLTDGRLIAALRRTFYGFVARISDDDLPVNAGEFRLVDARILAELRKVEDTAPYVRGLISAMGFSQVPLLYDRRERIAGDSKFPFLALVALAMDGVLNHSLLPLRVASLAGLVVGVITLLLTFVYLVGSLLFGQNWPAGFATTTILLLMSIAMNAIFMGILGEYVGRIFLQAKKRPELLIETSLNVAGDGDPDRTAHGVPVALQAVRGGKR